MGTKKVLFISGSLGLGHIYRDIAIANELRKQDPDIEISWLAAHPATEVITNAGEKLLPQIDQYANDNIPAEKSAQGSQLNLLKYLTKASKDWGKNFKTFKRITEETEFDLIIGDETYEIVVGLGKKPGVKNAPFVMIYDFIGLDSMSLNPLEILGTYMWNRIWSNDYKKGRGPIYDLALFIGEPDDVPDKKFGFMLPNRLAWAKALCKFVGFILPFEPKDYEDKIIVREKLGYGKGPLIICAIGGTSIGKQLLELCGQAYQLLRESIPDLRMIMVCGPRLSPDSLDVPQGVELKKFVPDLYKHFAASDLSIVQGGATSTLELTALNKPFLYFPIQGHFEQANVAQRLSRYQAGVRMSYSLTTPKILAEKIVSNLGKDVGYPSIQTNGAKNAAQHIMKLF
jgi:UDP-N-acetylglucosamine:LPS N-acetylglucosamine transferase